MGASPGPFEAFYASPLQHPWALWAVGLLGLAYALTRPGLSPGLKRYCGALGALTLLDAWLTANHVYGIGRFSGVAASLVPLSFVLAGDLRFLLLVPCAADANRLRFTPRSVGIALAMTAIVPLVSQVAPVLWPGTPRMLFLVYELAFAALTLGLLRWHPALAANAWLRPVGCFVLLYYGLWASADVAILLGSGPGADLGYALRVVPNLLYYGGLIACIGWAGARARRVD